MAKEQKTRKDNDPTMIVLRWFTNFIVKLLAKTSITPNMVTVLNFIIFVPAILYLLSQGVYGYSLFALLLIFVNTIFDLVDGSLARIKSLQSKLGGWMDGSFDFIFQNLLLMAVVIGVFQNSGEVKWFIVGLAMVFGQNMANYLGFLYDKDFGFEAYSGSEEFNCKFGNIKKISLIDSFLKNIIVPSNFVYIFFFTCRYLLLLGILFNRLDIFLIIFAITINIRWLSMYFLYLRWLHDTESKLYTVKFLKELYLKGKEAI